jgi:hypothetical protein
MSAEIDKAKEHLTALKAFIASPAHEGFVNAKTQEIGHVKARILMLPPINQENIVQQLMAHGEWDCLEEEVKTFESARVQLEARIDEMVEQENQNASNTKV